MTSDEMIIGYDYSRYYGYGERYPLAIDLSPKTNSHILLAGMSGSGKSYCLIQHMARMVLAQPETEIYFADFKQDDSFGFMRGCPRYYPYRHSLEALETVYTVLHQRQLGEDTDRHPVVLIWDEYVANMLALQNEDKKLAGAVMNKVSEILMLGRSLSVRLVTACQRPDACVFPSGARLNYGVIIVLGAAMRSIYEMVLPPEYTERIGDRVFKAGEGVVLLQGSELHFVKVPLIRNADRMQEICIQALSSVKRPVSDS